MTLDKDKEKIYSWHLKVWCSSRPKEKNGVSFLDFSSAHATCIMCCQRTYKRQPTGAQWNLYITKCQGTGKFVCHNEVSLHSRFFSIYFTTTEVKKIVRYIEDFVIWRSVMFHCIMMVTFLSLPHFWTLRLTCRARDEEAIFFYGMIPAWPCELQKIKILSFFL